jgi:hypothetical protein
MVSATPDSTDSRHATARKLGIPIIRPAEGSVRLDEAVREAELKAAWGIGRFVVVNSCDVRT